MKKEEYIKRYGEVAYVKRLQQSRAWNAQHHKKGAAAVRKWQANNPDKVKVLQQEQSHKGGKYYNRMRKYLTTGFQGERNRIRARHARLYQTIKEATPDSLIHHEWIPGTAKYTGVALVETEAHRHGIIKVIKILEGKITLFVER